MAENEFDFFATPATTGTANPAAPKFQDIFGSVPKEQLDPDPLGLVTEQEGVKRGTGWTRDTVEGLNIYGQFTTADELRGMDGGRELLDLASRKRQGRRGLAEALGTGPVTDFIPYVGDLASTGIAIKNMSKVRDSLRKMSEQGPESLTLQEKVLTKLYAEDMERQSNQTFGGTVGTILRQAPAFAFEFLTTGAVFRAGSAALGFGAKKAVTEMAERTAKNAAMKFATDSMRKTGMTRAALEYGDDVIKSFGDDAVAKAVESGLSKLETDAVRIAAEKTGQATLEAFKNPKHFKNAVEFVGEYAKRGLFDHMDNVVRDLPPGVLGKLREAAGVAFIEAPIKGALYAGFDFGVVNPIVAGVMGADEAVTKTELGLTATGNKELTDNAKMMAFGAAVAEYASEVSGRAFTALGGLVTDNLANNVGRNLARSGLRATRADYVNEGSVANRIFNYMNGTEKELKTGLASLKEEAIEAVSKSTDPKFLGKTVAEIRMSTELTDAAMKKYLGFRDKSFLGYWVANKALDKNITPQAVTRLLENMGYDDIVGEFMEERYNGFAQGLFGLDGQEHDSNIERIAHAVKSAIPSFQQGLAEIVAFSLPVMSRGMFSKAYEVLGQGTYGGAKELGDIVKTFSDGARGFTILDGADTRVLDVKLSDAGTNSAGAKFRADTGITGIADPAMLEPMYQSAPGRLTDLAVKLSAADTGAAGFWTGVGRTVLGLAQTAITGNPMAAFHDPARAIVGEQLGEDGRVLLNSAASLHRNLYRAELKRRAMDTAGTMEKEAEAAADAVPESKYNNPEILAAIRPTMEKWSKFLLKQTLRSRGAIVAEQADIDDFVDTLPKGADGTIGGVEQGKFKERFRDEIAAAVSGRMTFDVVGDRVNAVYRRPQEVLEEGTIGMLAKSVEEFMAQNDVSTAIDGDNANAGEMFRAFSGRGMDEGIMRTAAAIGTERGDPAVEKARMELATRIFVRPNFSDAASWKRMSESVGDYARVLLEVNEKFLRPQFDMGGRRVEVTGNPGGYYLAETAEGVTGNMVEGSKTFSTIAEAVQDAMTRGAVKRPASIYFTTNNTFVASTASQFMSKELGGSRNYLLGNRDYAAALKENPFYKTDNYGEALAQVTEDLRLAKLWQDRGTVPFKNAAEEKLAQEAFDRALGEEGYETIAAKAAEATGIRPYGVPDRRGKTGYIFEPAAISMEGAVYIPYRHLGSVTAIVEDGVENLIKRNKNVFMSADNPGEYGPVVKAFFNELQDMFGAIRDNDSAELKDSSGRPLVGEQAERLRKEASYLSDLFNPNVYNLEALSHAYAGIVFMQGDAARERGGPGMGGSAFYGTIGMIAKQARARTDTYSAFASLLNRATSGTMVEEQDSVLAKMVGSFVPRRFIDNAESVRTVTPGGVPYNPISDVGRMSQDLASYSKDALAGNPTSGFDPAKSPEAVAAEKAYYAKELALLIENQKAKASALGGGNVRPYYEEEYPFLLSYIKGERDELVKSQGRKAVEKAELAAIAAETPADVAAQAAADKAKENSEKKPGDTTASMAEETLYTMPAVAIALGTEWLKARPALSGDRRGKLDRIFDEWKRRDPLLKETSRQRFIDAVKAEGIWEADASGEEGALKTTATAELEAIEAKLAEEGETEGEGETQGLSAEADENGVVPTTDANGFNPDAAARALETSPFAKVLRMMFHMHLPAAQHNDQEALEMFVDASAALYPKGMKDKVSLASLFDEEMWTRGVLHPALTDETAFNAWLDQDRPEKGVAMFDDMVSMMKALGLTGTAKGADKLKGSTVKTVFTGEAVVDADGKHVSVRFVPRMQSLSSEVAESLLRSAVGRGNKAAEAVKLLEAEELSVPPGRLDRMADAADLLFGQGNFISQVLRKPSVRVMMEPLLRAKDKTYTQWFVAYGKEAPAGLLTQRLLFAARLMEAGKPEAAVRELLRGDAIRLQDASNRGGMLNFLHDAAGTISVTSSARMGENAGKVRAIDPSLSAGQKAFLKSEEFRKAYLAYKKAKSPKSTTDTFLRDMRFARWHDGTPVFAAMNGVRRRGPGEAENESVWSEVANPAYDEVSDLAALDYTNGVGDMTNVAVYNSEKELERLVTLPRVALAAITGTDSPSYRDMLGKVSALMKISELSPKRGAHHMGGGEAAEKQNVRVAILLTEDAKARENLHGVGYIGDSDFAEYYRMQGFGSAAKVVLTESPVSGGRTFFSKGQFILADNDPKEGAVTPAAMDLFRIAKNYAYLSDMDSFKECALYYKAADGSKRKLLDLILADELDVEVEIPDGTRMKAKDLVAELGVEVETDTVNGATVQLVSMRMGLRSQWASAPSKVAHPKHNDVPVNYAMDNPQMWPLMLAQSRVKAALFKRTMSEAVKKAYDGLTDSVKELLDAGVSPRDPGILKSLGPKLASAFTKAFKPTMTGQKYLNRNFDGARVVEDAPNTPRLDAKGRMVISDPFGSMKVLPGGIIHDTYELSAEESAEMGGATRRLASTASNIGGVTARYGLRAIPAAMGLKDGDHQGIMDEIARRVKLLKTAELRSFAENDPSVYLRAYREFIEGAFTDHNGNDIPAGMLMSFADLVDRSGNFDRTRLYSVKEQGNDFVFLNGQIDISGRTPSRDGRRAEYAHAVAMPAYMEEADGSQFYLVSYVKRDGTIGAKRVFYPEGTLVPGKDAIVVMTPEAKYLAGSDEDWDTSHSQRLPTDSLGREIPGLDNAEALIGTAATDKEATRIADRAVSGLEAAGFWEALGVHRVYDRMMNPVSAMPFSKEHAATVPAVKTPGLGTPEAAEYARQNKDIGNVSRGIAVKVMGDLEAAIDIGMSFERPVAGGAPVIAGVAVGKATEWSDARRRAFITAASGAANSTFDDLKEALASRAGFRPEFFDLYLYLGFESGAETMAQYEAFHTKFMAWMNGPDGVAVTTAYRNETYPAKHGGASLTRRLDDTAKALANAAREEADEGRSFHYQLYQSMSRPHKRMVQAMAVQNGGGTTGFDKVYSVVQTLDRLQKYSAVGTVLSHKKANLSDTGAVAGMESAIKTVEGLLTNSKAGLVLSDKGRNDVSEALDVAKEMVANARSALAGSVEYSVLYMAAVEGDLKFTGEMKKASGGLSKSDAVKHAIDTRLPYEAAALLTPASTGAKIDQIKAAAEGNPTGDFLAVVESALRGIYETYAASKGAANAALDALLAPGKGSGATRITLTGSDGTAAAAETLQQGMEALRDWKPSDRSVGMANVKLRGGQFLSITPADFYWMLMQYSALTSGMSVETGRANQSILRAFYGAAVYKKLSDYRIASLDSMKSAGRAERLLQFTTSLTTDYDNRGVRKEPLKGIPDVLASMARWPWGTYDRAMKIAPAVETKPVAEQPMPEAPKPVETVKADVVPEVTAEPAAWRMRMTPEERVAFEAIEAAVAKKDTREGTLIDTAAGITKDMDFIESPTVIDAYGKHKAVLGPMMKESLSVSLGGEGVLASLTSAVKARPETGGEKAELERRAGQLDLFLDRTDGPVKLSSNGPYAAKDQAKSDKATKFIGRGSAASSTARYAKDWGTKANTGKYTSEDVVFVSAEGARTGRVAPDFDELDKAADAGVTFITDDAANRSRPYNTGEREVSEFLRAQGYSETGPGKWTRPSLPGIRIVSVEAGEVYGMRGPGGSHMNSPGMTPGQRGWLGNPTKWEGNGGAGSLDNAIEGFRTLFLRKVDTDQRFRDAVLALRGKSVGYYRPQAKNHLGVINDWLATNPVASVPAPVEHTEASAAWKNARAWAKRVSLMATGKNQRRLASFAKDGLAEAGRMTSVNAKQAAEMGQALRQMAELPWMRQVPGAKETVEAAERILVSMRYPEPAVFLGTVRALGRMASAAGSADAADELGALYRETGMSKVGDAVRLGLLRDRDAAAILAAAPALRVMTFAVASEPNLVIDASVSTGTMAKRILRNLETGSADTKVAVVTPATVNIWAGSGENAILSNLALRPFEFNGLDFLSVEHAYQTFKSGKVDQGTYDKYLKYPQAGVKIAGTLPADTKDGRNLYLMRQLMRESFRNNPAAREALMDTGDATLTHTQDTGIWRTEFPKIITDIRNDLLIDYRPIVLSEEGPSASMDEGIMDAYTKESARRATQVYTTESAKWRTYVKAYNDRYKKYAVAADAAPDLDSARKAIAILAERGPSLFRRLTIQIERKFLSDVEPVVPVAREVRTLAVPQLSGIEARADGAVGHLEPAERPVQQEFDFSDAGTVAKAVEDASASMYDDKPFSITDEELQVYIEDEKAGKYYAAETLQAKFQKRLKALIPPMPDDFTDSRNGWRTYKDAKGVWRYDFGMYTGRELKGGVAYARGLWEEQVLRNQAGSFSTVAQSIEDWKRDEGIVYNPNDAYSRGEGIYHDVGAFNPSAPGLIGGVAKVLLAQEKKRRAGDLNYWEDTNNQLVVSAYTHKVKGPGVSVGWTIHLWDWDGSSAQVAYVDTEEQAHEYVRQHPSDTLSVTPGKPYVAAEDVGVKRPGSGLRFVIRPSAQNILWAAKGDVYSGTVNSMDGTFDPDEMSVVKLGDVWAVEDGGFNIAKTGFASKEDAYAYLRKSGAPRVDPKAPAATKLGLLSTTLAGAIEDRRQGNYNELGVRLALGNFYIEEADPRLTDEEFDHIEAMGGGWDAFSAAAEEAEGEKRARSTLPKELRRLNEHLKRAFIRVHGSLDPVAPYTPKTIKRAAGEVSASAAYATDLVDILRDIDKATARETGDEHVDRYVERVHQGDKRWRKRTVLPKSIAVRVPLFLGSDPTGRKQVYSHITEAVRELEGLKGLGAAREAVLNALDMIFQPATNQTVPKDVADMNGKRYGQYMAALGNSEVRAFDALEQRFLVAEELTGPARDNTLKDLAAAERVLVSALLLARSAAAALRPNVHGIVNPLRAQIKAMEAEKLTPPVGIEPNGATQEAVVSAVSVLSPDDGHVDSSDDFNVTFIDSDAWFYGSVMPNFRGTDIRQILFDKEPIAMTAAAFALSNRFEAYFGLDSETGSLRRITRTKGMGHHLRDGGYVYDGDSAADTLVMGRRKIIKEQVDIASGNAFTDDEFVLARWFGNAVYAFLGDGGDKARQALAGEVRFDLDWKEIADMSRNDKIGEFVEAGEKTSVGLRDFISLAEAQRRVGNTTDRTYAVHELLLRAKDSIPTEFMPFVERALQDAVEAGSKAPKGRESQVALAALEKAGYAVARHRILSDMDGNETGKELYDVRLAIPVTLTKKLFETSSAREKLINNGRRAEELTMEANADELRAAFAKVDASAGALGWMAQGDAKFFHDIGTAAPFFKGSGAYQYFARKLQRPVTPEYKDAVMKAADSLRESFQAMRSKDAKGNVSYLSGDAASRNVRFARMFNLLKDLHPQTFSKDADATSVWATIVTGQASGLSLNADSTAWDIAKVIYSSSVAKLHDSAWNMGQAAVTDVQTIGLEAFNRALGESAVENNEPLQLRGATFSDIYDVTGALPQNLTAGEALALHAREVSEATRYRLTLNQLLMTADENGMPLVYARPGLNAADDTVPDTMWGHLARWWVDTNTDSQGRGVFYDETQSGRENATRLFDLVTVGKVSEDVKQTASGGLLRYTLTNVEIPQGMETFSAVVAAKDKAGDDTKARMNAFGGGEAANVTRQVFAIAGYGRPDARLAQMNRALSWSKSASVMASLFFPIATAFESPVAAVGLGPTLFGLGKTGADLARWLEKNHGWIAKAAGVGDVGQSPFMADILRVIGSDDPALADLKVHALLSGMSLADRAKNLTDMDRTVIAQDIKAVTSRVRAVMGSKAAKSTKALLEGAMEHSSEVAFEYVINATKLAVFAQMNNRLRQKALAAGRWWDPVRDMKKWANYINAEVGGIDPAMYPWMTPKMQQVMKATMFSWEWTLGAWEAGGGGILTQKWFGQTTPGNIRKFMLGRWIRMYGAVMIGLPLTMQMIGLAIAKAAGDDEDDDKWFTWQNEKGKDWKDFDITPMLRAIANTHIIPFTDIGPTFGEIKRKEIPIISALIPALTGQEGEMVTTRKRRYYMHMGKQGWEVAGWFENPTKSFLSKMSMPAQKILEGVLGVTPSMGWEKPFAELGFWERWTSLDPEKSALVNLGSAFLPFSVMGAQRTPELGALVAVGPASKGMSKTKAEKEMAAMFMTWGDAESYAAMRKGKPGAWTDLTGMATEWLEALRLNGYDAETSLKNALAAAREPLYEKVHKALPAFPDGKANTAELEEAARGLYRLDYVAKNLMKSIKARDKAQHIKRAGDLGKITDELLRDAFQNPYGPAQTDKRLKQSAAGGGNVRKLLASDKLPAAVIGYKVLKTEELSAKDLAFFRDNPESPGFFDKGDK